MSNLLITIIYYCLQFLEFPQRFDDLVIIPTHQGTKIKIALRATFVVLIPKNSFIAENRHPMPVTGYPFC